MKKKHIFSPPLASKTNEWIKKWNTEQHFDLLKKIRGNSQFICESPDNSQVFSVRL